MTPDEYNKKYNLSLTSDINTSSLIVDLLNDFYKLTESLGCDSIQQFYTNVSLFRTVFNKIANQSNADDLWIEIWDKFFIKTKDFLYEMFPEEKERQYKILSDTNAKIAEQQRKKRIKKERLERERLERERIRQEKIRQKKEEANRAREEGQRSYNYKTTYSNLNNSYSSYFTTLNLTLQATSDEVKKNYRKLAIQHHPDKIGGNSAKFIEVTEAKEKCLSYIKNTR